LIETKGILVLKIKEQVSLLSEVFKFFEQNPKDTEAITHLLNVSQNVSTLCKKLVPPNYRESMINRQEKDSGNGTDEQLQDLQEEIENDNLERKNSSKNDKTMKKDREYREISSLSEKSETVDFKDIHRQRYENNASSSRNGFNKKTSNNYRRNLRETTNPFRLSQNKETGKFKKPNERKLREKNREPTKTETDKQTKLQCSKETSHSLSDDFKIIKDSIPKRKVVVSNSVEERNHPTIANNETVNLEISSETKPSDHS